MDTTGPVASRFAKIETVALARRVMDDQERKRRAHELDVTVWVGKEGVESVVDELDSQLESTELVKVKFLRAARAGSDTEELAAALAEDVSAELINVRGHTAVVGR